MTEDASWATEPLFYEAPHPPGATPRPYQQAGVEYHLARDNALFGDEPGLGKTAQCILLGNAIEAKRTLVVCPASLRLNWEREIWRWSIIPTVRTYPVMAARDGVSPEAHYVITSYDMLRNDGILAALLALRWEHLILDEAHYLKDPRGNKRTRAICAEDGLRSVVGRITMASGTILPNQPVECYNALRLLDWGAIDHASLEDFREYYYDRGEGFITGPYMGAGGVRKYGPHWSTNVRNVPRNLDDLRSRLRSRVMVRRLKKDVEPQLPPRVWHPFPLATTPGMRRALKHEGWRAVERLLDLGGGAFKDGVPIDGAVSEARRLLGEEKAPAVADYVDELLLSGVEKVVVGAWHISVLKMLRERLERWGVVYMDGSTSGRARQAAVDAFQSDGDVRIILGQMQPLGEGWTLTAARDVVLAEPSWVPGRNDQLLDRCHRIGTTGGMVTGHVPVVPDSLDERVMAVVVGKDAAIYRALDHRG